MGNSMTALATKKLYIKTYGCQMNVYDSERMAGLLKPYGYEVAEDYQDAGMVILNTCHIREKAAEKVYGELGRLRQEKERLAKKGQEMLIAVAGCVGQAEGEEIFKRAPYVDIVVGPQSYYSLPDLIGKVRRDKGYAINLEFEDDKFDKLPGIDTSVQNGSACVSIQEGCDKFCTFCVVPYTRGAEYSRPVADIYRECLILAGAGAVEITLLGQNVNAYHGFCPEGTSWNLGQLIAHIAHIPQIKRIRYSTSHPRDMHDTLYDVHGQLPQVMPFLNLPVQSGSNAVLRAMNRKHTREDYFKIIDRLRALRPEMQFSSDFIIGFPGETDADFEATLDLAKQVNFIQGYSFKYSPRPGTPGAEMENQVSEEIKTQRLAIFQKQINAQQLAFNESCVGQIMEILPDRPGKQSEQLIGRTPFMQSVYVKNMPVDLLGKLVSVKIIGGYPHSLQGELV